jgi:hypothetical protein
LHNSCLKVGAAFLVYKTSMILKEWHKIWNFIFKNYGTLDFFLILRTGDELTDWMTTFPDNFMFTNCYSTANSMGYNFLVISHICI